MNMKKLFATLLAVALALGCASAMATSPGNADALSQAQSYLRFMAFSREGLIDQLEYEGFSHSDAVYAVDNCGADWYEQAAKKAESYLEIMSFSTSGLISQLEFEGFTHDEAMLLDIMLMLHAEHGGGNNSTFTTRVLSSSGTDAYSAYAGALGSLKGPKHGGANYKAGEMIDDICANVSDWSSDDEVGAYIEKILNRKAFDRTGLIYGLGHAVYTITDPRAEIVKRYANSAAGEPFLLFRGSSAPWAREVRHSSGRAGYVTDGPFLWRGEDGRLYCLWAGFSDEGYTEGLAVSQSGALQGPYAQLPPLFKKDGGHGMLFNTFDGRTLLTLHRPNAALQERPVLLATSTLTPPFPR